MVTMYRESDLPMQDIVAETAFRDMLAGEFQSLKHLAMKIQGIPESWDGAAKKRKTVGSEKRPGFTVGTNGSMNYSAPQDESEGERRSRERYWRSMGKKVRNGDRIR